jgi:multicomponent Na+:H+ antiporter subunit G
MNLLGGAFMLGGVFFLFSATVGYLRLPDFFTRMHAISKSDTLGALLSVLGVACLAGWSLLALKFAFIAVFIFLANPVATHALSRAGLLAGVKPWTRQPDPFPNPPPLRGGGN